MGNYGSGHVPDIVGIFCSHLIALLSSLSILQKPSTFTFSLATLEEILAVLL